MSLLDTSSLLPTDANEEIPIPSLVRWSTIAKPRPPDCMTRPATPGAGLAAANVASRPIDGTAIPKQFGPISRLTFNYAPIAVAVVIGYAGLTWLLSARHWFTGPKVQGTAEELAAIEQELAS